MEQLNSISVAVGIFGTIMSIVSIIVLLRRNSKADDNSDGRLTGTMQSDIGYIKSGVDDIKRKQERQDDVNLRLKKEITEAHEAASSAHKRIDGLETRLNRME